MLIRARYQHGKLIFLEPLPELDDGQEVMVSIETIPRPMLPTSTVIVNIQPEDFSEVEITPMLPTPTPSGG